MYSLETGRGVVQEAARHSTVRAAFVFIPLFPTPSARYLRRISDWTLLAVALLLAGCVNTPVPPLHPPLPKAWRNAPAQASGAETVPVLANWWQALGDADLDALAERALAGNLTLAQAGERVRAARRLMRVADARWLPSTRFGTDDAVAPDRARSYILPGFDASWELPLFGAGTSSARVAEGDLHGIEAEWRGARVTLMAELVRTWVALQEARGQMQGLQAMQAGQQRRASLEQRSVALGLSSATDVATLSATAARLDTQISLERQRARLAAQQLALLLGQPEPDPAWLRTAPVMAWKMPEIGSIPVEQLRHQPAIAQAEAAVVSAAGTLGLRKADLYPHVGLGAALQWVLETTDGNLRGRGTILSIGPSIDIPLFDWGQRVARKDAAGHALKAALLAYREAVLQGVHDVESALIEWQEAGVRSRAAEAARRAAGDAEAQVQRAQELQLADELGVVAAQAQRQQAVLAERAAQADQILAWVALNKALGAGAPVDALLPSAATPMDSAGAGTH